ncbi:MAG TPA: cytochrome c-type biogenesis protein [Stellaceae bacterium]|nr:cytochrome c-type biogenesis protein [Stellaceae bacterium]
MKRLALVAALFLLALSAVPARAVQPDEMLANKVLEARAEKVGRELRCLVCRNESIEASDAGLAHDLRLLIRRRILAGDSDAQVIAYVRSRYGDFVLLKPPFELSTVLLWGGPLLLVLLGAIGVRRFYRNQPEATATPPLTEDERQQLSALLKGGAES